MPVISKKSKFSLLEMKQRHNLHMFLSIAIAVGLFTVLVSSLEYLKQPAGFTLGGQWEILHEGKQQTVNIPYYQPIGEEGVYTYRKQFGVVEADTLVISDLSAYGYQISLNGTMIKKLNEEETKTANIWNRTLMVVFDSALLKNQNLLEIQIYTVSDHGINTLPYLAYQKDVLDRVAISHYLENDVYLFSIGASVTLAFVLFALGLGIPEKKGFHYSFALGMVFVGVYLLDYPYRIYSGNPTVFLIFKKIIFSSLYFSGLMLLQGVEYYLYGKKRFSKGFRWIIGIIIGIFLFLPDFNTVRNFNGMVLFVLFTMVIFATVQIYLKRDSAFIFAATILALCAINDMLKVIFSLNFIYMIRFGIIITVLSIGFLLVEFFRNTYGSMMIANGKAMRDPLTGAFNRNVLEKIQPGTNDMLVLLDFDDFKMINDIYGHAEGDWVLTTFTQKTLELLRVEDMLIRIGGDEFMIVMKNCSETTAIARVEKIRQMMAQTIERYDFSFSYGHCSLQNGITDAFSTSDERLYRMKNARKQKDCSLEQKGKGD